MNRSRTLIPVLLLTVVAMLMFGLSAALAADTTPSFELTGIAGANSCHAGHPQFHYTLNQDGNGSMEGWIGQEGMAHEGSYAWVNFNGETNGPATDTFGVPGIYPENTILYFEVNTFSNENGEGTRTFTSKISFNCTTGEQVGPVINQAYPDGLPRLNLDIVDGPAWVHPLDIRSQIDIRVLPQLSGDPIGGLPQQIGRVSIGG